MNIQNKQQNQKPPMDDKASIPLVLPFTSIDAHMLSVVGGKAANLGELTRAGLPVPPGFCVTTAAYALVAAGAGLEAILDELAAVPPSDTDRLSTCAAAARARLLAVSIPSTIVEAISEAYQQLTHNEPIPMAVRSSATAEDLPFASFAGQQDTYLNIVGIEAILDAVRRCWASLWTDRAVSYRAGNGIDHRTVHLAVAVQRMVEAQVAGVLFTANPLTGRRHQAVIDASPGLGEAVVSGAVNPDHFVVNAATSEIIERRLGDKRLLVHALPGGGTQRIELPEQNSKPCLTDDQVVNLAKLGMRVEDHYGVPQDTEWAIDANGSAWLTQARPITTLFPLPPGATEDPLRVYFSLNVAQGVYGPFTPMGIAAFRLMTGSVATLIGFPPKDRLAGPPAVVIAASRLFFDITTMLRNPLGRDLLIRIMGSMEARSGVVFQRLVSDPRLALRKYSRWKFLRRLLAVLIRARIPFYVAQALLRPEAARKRASRLQSRLQALSEVPAGASANDRMLALEQLFSKAVYILSSIAPVVLFAGFPLVAWSARLLKGLATDDERQTVLRALPYNPTTEMDLALWRLAQQIRADASAAQWILDTPSEQLAQQYRAGTLPAVLQKELADFLGVYGHRAIAEIDMGLPRWSEDPAHILGVLANYLQLKNPELAPDVQFARGAREADAMVVELTRRARKRSWLQGKLVQFCLTRIRALFGLREVPKYCLVLLLTGGRRLLLPVGEELARAGCLEVAEDIFFIDIAEARQALAGKDFREVVRGRRADYRQEMARRHIPRVLLSDGTEPEMDGQHATETTADALKGAPASGGMVTAKARVIFDPVGAHLEPGEILVAPSTDPGWTPLFLTAGGLVMEMGGPMSHGAIVARECGIPAVVGVPQATQHISTGQQITVDGSAGTITIEHETST